MTTCPKTVTYPTAREAQRELLRMWRNPKQRKLPVRWWWCKEHKGYHLTSKPRMKGSGSSGR